MVYNDSRKVPVCEYFHKSRTDPFYFHCFTAWMAGGGIKPGITYGATDDYGYNILGSDGHPISKPSKDGKTPEAVHVHDFHATILNQLGIDHTRLTHSFQGRHFRLTDVHGRIVKEILA